MFTTISMKKILLGILPVLFFVACTKKDLPDNNTTGSNTFGAKIDGVNWVAQGFGPFPANDIVEARMSGNDLIINARNFSQSPNETEFQLTIYGVTATGVYNLNTNVSHPNGTSSYGYYVKRNVNPINEYITSSTYTGTVTITKLDMTNRIASGTFQFDLGSTYNSEVLHITEGRFDVKIL